MDGRNYEFLCRRLALLQNTGIFCEENGELISWQENPESNPLYLNKELRQLLYEHAVQQEIPLSGCTQSVFRVHSERRTAFLFRTA